LQKLSWVESIGLDGLGKWIELHCNGFDKENEWFGLHGLYGFRWIGLGGWDGGIGFDLVWLNGLA